MMDTDFSNFLMGVLTVSVFMLTVVLVYMILKNTDCCDRPDCDPDCIPEDCETDCKSKCQSGSEFCGAGNRSTKEEAPKQEDKGYTGTDC